ncbi:MAG: hypothetical protein KBG28_18130 [Kofleriaceae bacterium]|nr:hypothetical protein [Kofleriaceae bacterium]
MGTEDDDRFAPPAAGDDAPLELADVPRGIRGRGPSTNPPPGPADASRAAPPPGAAAPLGPADEARARALAMTSALAAGAGGHHPPSPWRRWISFGVALLVGSAVVWWLATSGRTVKQVHGTYRSKTVGVTLELPLGAWKTATDHRRVQRLGSASASVEMFYRGKSIDDPDVALALFRWHAPGMFGATVDLDQLTKLARERTQLMTMASGMVVGALDCGPVSGVRPEPAAACLGKGTLRDEGLKVYLLLWADTVEDLIGVITFTRDDGDPASVGEALVRTVRPR